VSIDGRSVGELAAGDAITCTAAAEPARLVTFDPRSFLEIVKVKFGLGAR
jgi:NAD kinase